MNEGPHNPDEKARLDALLMATVRELRLRLNLSQDAFAKIIGSSPRTVARFEGEQAPSDKFLIQLSRLARAKGHIDLAKRFASAFAGKPYRARPELYLGNSEFSAKEEMGVGSDLRVGTAPGNAGLLESAPVSREFRDLDSPDDMESARIATWNGRITPLGTSVQRIASTAGYDHFRGLFKELIARSVDSSTETREQLFLLCADRIETDPKLAHLRGLLHEMTALVANDAEGDTQ